MSTIFRDAVSVNDIQFNTGVAVDGVKYHVDIMDGWKGSGQPRVVLTEFGYSDGVAAAARFPVSEKYVEFGGWVKANDRAAAERAEDVLRDLFAPIGTLRVVRQGPTARAMDMRPVTGLDIVQDVGAEGFRWLVRLMAEWPFQFSPEEQEVVAGVFSGRDFARYYIDATNARYYPSGFARFYQEALPGGVGTTVQRNRAQDPKGLNTTFFTGAGGTLAAVAGGMQFTTTTSGGLENISPRQGGVSFPISPGEPAYTRVKVTNNHSVTIYVAIINSYTDGGGSIVSGGFVGMGSRVAIAAGASAVLEYTYASAPAGSVAFSTGVFPALAAGGGVAPVGTKFITSEWVVDSGATAPTTTGQPYFDGDSPDFGAVQYEWEGIADQSVSYGIDYSAVPPATGNPDSATIDNNGNADTYPIITVTGPLLSGEWEIVNETTGEVQSFGIDLSSGQSLVIDSKEKTAFMEEEPVDYYLRGDWIRLVPGTNVLRLVTDEDNPDATLSVRAPVSTWR